MTVESLAPAQARGSDAMSSAKRALDLLFSLLAPLFLFIGLAIKLCDGGPVLFWQKRVGRDGVEFDFPKFRSMIPDAERRRRAIESQNHHGGGAVTFKIKNDPRITPVGRLLRRYSLDELPQLWCVLKGDMSLVGPRPLDVSESLQCAPWQRRRLAVVPGLTCIWQVRGRSTVTFEEWMRMDLEYLRHRSFSYDLRLLLSTIPSLVLQRGPR